MRHSSTAGDNHHDGGHDHHPLPVNVDLVDHGTADDRDGPDQLDELDHARTVPVDDDLDPPSVDEHDPLPAYDHPLYAESVASGGSAVRCRGLIQKTVREVV